jgi:hypothetical protein
MKKVTKAEQAKRKKVAQKRVDYTNARSLKTIGKRTAVEKLLANKVPNIPRKP